MIHEAAGTSLLPVEAASRKRERISSAASGRSPPRWPPPTSRQIVSSSNLHQTSLLPLHGVAPFGVIIEPHPQGRWLPG
jgi:hypothetical protein